MTITFDFAINLGNSFAGLTDLRAQIVDVDGSAVGSADASNFVEIGSGYYLWHTDALDETSRGGVKIYRNAAPTAILAFGCWHPFDFAVGLGAGLAGLTDLRAQVVDTLGANVGAVQTNLVEIGSGFYLWSTDTLTEAQTGGVKFYSAADPTNVLVFGELNPLTDLQGSAAGGIPHAGLTRWLEMALNLVPAVTPYVAVGTGTTAYDPDDTTLETELERVVASTVVVQNGVATVKGFFNTGQANGTLGESGLLTASSAGVLLARVIEAPPQVKTASQELIVQYDITLAGA